MLSVCGINGRKRKKWIQGWSLAPVQRQLGQRKKNKNIEKTWVGYGSALL